MWDMPLAVEESPPQSEIVSRLEPTHLHIGARIPVGVKQYHPISTSEVDPHAPGSSSQKHDEYRFVRIEAINKGLWGGTKPIPGYSAAPNNTVVPKINTIRQNMGLRHEKVDSHERFNQ